MPQVTRLCRVGLNVVDLDGMTQFYQQALGFTLVSESRTTIAGARCTRRFLQLGAQCLELTRFDCPGQPIPADSTSSDLWFQHVAIVVTDIGAAQTRLACWKAKPITEGGPQHLPPQAGGVWAYKFRDPEGHPLELLQFPPESAPPVWRNPPPSQLHVGYDHSAISVSNIAASLAYYTDRLGLRLATRQTNQGPAQQRLDAAPSVEVEVIGLRPVCNTPHVELLGYHTPQPRSTDVVWQVTDSAATRLVFGVEGQQNAMLERDPDGHVIVLETVMTDQKPA